MKSCVDNMARDIVFNGKYHLYHGIIGDKYILDELDKPGETLLAVNQTAPFLILQALLK